MTPAELVVKRNESLALANAIRIANAKLKREIAALSYVDGCSKVAELLAAPSGPVGSMRIGQLLTSINGVAEYGMKRFLRHAGIFSTTKRVNALTPRQVAALRYALSDRTVLWPTTRI